MMPWFDETWIEEDLEEKTKQNRVGKEKYRGISEKMKPPKIL